MPEKIPGTEVVAKYGSKEVKKAQYECFCGNLFTTNVSSVIDGHTDSCGCFLHGMTKAYWDYKDNYEYRMQIKILSIIRKNGFYYGEFQCHCGRIYKVKMNNIRNGASRSCGKCLRRWENAPYRGTINKNPSEQNFKLIKEVYERNALKRKLKFDFTITDFKNICMQKCHYCGCSPSSLHFPRINRSDPFLYNGIDRVDNTRGYEKKNCVACCSLCNYLKSKDTLEKFYSRMNIIHKHIGLIIEYRITNNEAHRTSARVPLTNDSRALVTSTKSRQEQARVT